MNAEAEAKGEELRAAGEKAYVIPGGGSNSVGALGYVSCAQELLQQADEMGLRIDRLVTATGSAGTQAGLVVGLEGCNAGIPVLGIGVRAPKDRQEANVHRLAEETADYVGARGGVSRAAVVANCDYVGPGYGQPTPGMTEAVLMLARLEGVLLDPVYSGKAMAGLIDLIRKGEFRQAARRWCSCTPAARWGCSAIPRSSSRQWCIRRCTTMLRSQDRILTTHTGSLPRPAALTQLYVRRRAGSRSTPLNWTASASRRCAISWQSRSPRASTYPTTASSSARLSFCTSAIA